MEHALIASSDSGGSAYPPSSSSAVSPSTISIQDVQPLPQPATAVPVKNNSVDGSSSTNAAVEKKKPKTTIWSDTKASQGWQSIQSK